MRKVTVSPISENEGCLELFWKSVFVSAGFPYVFYTIHSAHHTLQLHSHTVLCSRLYRPVELRLQGGHWTERGLGSIRQFGAERKSPFRQTLAGGRPPMATNDATWHHRQSTMKCQSFWCIFAWRCKMSQISLVFNDEVHYTEKLTLNIQHQRIMPLKSRIL